MWDFFSRLFDPSGFMPRAQCGVWSEGLIRLHNIADVLIWLSYMAIPAVLVFFVRRRRDIPFSWMFWMFGLFIISCGFTHLMDVILFSTPVYRLSGLVKAITAVASVATVVGLVPLVPRALALRSPQELEREVAERRRVEDELRRTHAELERHVQKRTAELGAANAALTAEIAERRRAEEELRSSEATLRAILTSAVDSIITIDEQGRIESVNPATERLFGYTTAELLGQNVSLLMPSPYHEEHDAYLAHYRRTAERRIIGIGREVVARRKDGSTFPIALSVSEAHLGARRLFTGIVHDITERQRAEAGLRQARDELEVRVRERTAELAAANRELARSNRQLQEFALVASHDLQEPLRKIQLFGERLEGRLGASAGPAEQDYLRRMQQAARRMGNLITGLLAYAQVTTKGQPFTPVELGPLAREVVADLEVRLDETGGQVDVGELPTVEADPLQMRQLVQNLVGNALKFHRPGVPPAVAVRADLAEGGRLCRLTVQDNGIGFDEKYQERIFALFQRLHGRDEYEGTGMGLAIVRKIVERHGGSITACGVPGRGATFTVTLPIRQHQGDSSHEPGVQAASRPDGR
jgi:two-component system sensor kinase FixL